MSSASGSSISGHPIHQATQDSLFAGHSPAEFYDLHGVVHQESFTPNADRKMKMFTQSWQPSSVDTGGIPLRGLVCLIHGYTADSSWFIQLTAVAIAKLGFYACALDLRGHGQSDGLRGHIPKIDPVVDDCVNYFDSVRAQHPGLPAFLYGESLGGAVAVLVCLRQPRQWAGLVLSGAMFGVSNKYKPPWPLEELLPLASFFFSPWKLLITKSLTDCSYKKEWKRKLARRNPFRVVPGKPTTGTALEFLRVCDEIGRRSRELETPLLVVHGEEDIVCDAESAKMVFATAVSKDKTMKILPGMWHQLIGEAREDVDLAFEIIFSWLQELANKQL